MPMPQDAVGHFIDFIVPRGGMPVINRDANTVNRVLTGQTKKVNAKLWTTGSAGWEPARPAAPSWVPGRPTALKTPGSWVNAARPGGAHLPAGSSQFGVHRQNWNFTFLNYCPGYVTVTPVDTGVLTGPLSGCYVFRYTENGVPKVAHVGTADDPGDERSINAKDDWVQFIKLAKATSIMGGSAFDMFTPAEIARAVLGDPMDVPICCYVTAHEAWAVLFAKVSNASRPPPGGLMKVVAAKRMTFQRWEDLSKLRKFSGQASGEKVKGAFRLS